MAKRTVTSTESSHDSEVVVATVWPTDRLYSNDPDSWPTIDLSGTRMSRTQYERALAATDKLSVTLRVLEETETSSSSPTQTQTLDVSAEEVPDTVDQGAYDDVKEDGNA